MNETNNIGSLSIIKNVGRDNVNKKKINGSISHVRFYPI